jgi:flagellar basal-body rod modification protein FlgD
MTTTSSIGGTGFGGLGLDPPSDATRDRKALGQAEFFELLVAQLQNQDPLKPLDSNEFLGQVAQFTAVNGIQEMQRSFADLASALGSSQALQASTLVGREVQLSSPVGYLAGEGGLEGSVRLPQSTQALTVTVQAPDGRLVRQMTLGAHEAGEVAFSWDGVTDAGQRARPGVYSIAATVKVEGETLALETLVSARVDSVTLGRAGAEMQLNLAGLGSVPLSQVDQIR